MSEDTTVPCPICGSPTTPHDPEAPPEVKELVYAYACKCGNPWTDETLERARVIRGESTESLAGPATSLRDGYLDALALMQAHASDDLEGLETILANTDSGTLLACISDLALLTGSRVTGTPGDPSAYLAAMRAEIMGLRDE